MIRYRITNAGRGAYYSPNRLHFKKITSEFEGKLMAPGAYRPDLTDPSDNNRLRWGSAMAPGKDPHLVRFVRAINECLKRAEPTRLICYNSISNFPGNMPPPVEDFRLCSGAAKDAPTPKRETPCK